MAEKCLMAATLAALVFHPSSTIRCFNPKGSPISPQKQTQKTHQLEKEQSRKLQKNPPCYSIPSLTSVPRLFRSRPITDRFTELLEGGPLFRVVKKVFLSGWPLEMRVHFIDKILKVNHNEGILHRFEEYRGLAQSHNTTSHRGAERVAVDRNEVLGFQGSVITCSSQFIDGTLITCNKKSCGFCKLFQNCTVSPKAKHTLVFGNSRAAHEKISKEPCLAKKARTMKAMLICRVIAGRIGKGHRRRMQNGEESGDLDSVILLKRDHLGHPQDTMVCNSNAILPCFLVIYRVP